MCHFTDISDSKIDLADVALMNELLDLRAINDRRLQEAQRNEPPTEFHVPSPFR